MIYLRTFNENWKRNSTIEDLKEIADYIDDILLEIDDMEYPFTEFTFINSNNQIMFEISPNENGTLDGDFILTDEIYSIIQRCYNYVKSENREFKIYVEYKENQHNDFIDIDQLSKFVNKEVIFIGVIIV